MKNRVFGFKNLRLSIPVVLYCLIFSIRVYAGSGNEKNTDPLVFLGNKNLPPMVYIEDNSPKGIVVDIVTAIEEKIGRSIKIQPMDWAAAQKIVEHGGADALIQINVTKEREKIFDFSDPLLQSKFRIFVRIGTAGISGSADLRSRRVGVEEKGLPEIVLQKDPLIRLVKVPSTLEGFYMMKEGKIDAVVVDEWVGKYILSRNDINGISIIGEPIAILQSSIAVKKGNKELLKAVNTGIRKIREDGTYREITEKWELMEVAYQTREQIKLKYYRTVITVLALFAGVIILWSILLLRYIFKGKRLDKALIEERRRLSDIISGTNTGTWEWNPQTGSLIINKLWAEMIGYTLEELSPVSFETWKRLIYPDDLKEARAQLDKFFTGEIDYYNVQFRMKHRDGGLVWINSRGNVNLRDSYGKPLLVSGVHIDITKSRLADDVLRESEERFRNMFEKHSAVMLLVNPDTGRIVEANNSAVSFYGYDKLTLFSMNINSINILSEDEIREQRLNAIKQKQNYFIFPHKLSSGEIRQVEVHSSPISFHGENILFSIIHDITERKQAEDALRESEDKYMGIYNSSLDAILLTAPGGSIFAVNSSTCRMFERSEEEILSLGRNGIMDVTDPRLALALGERHRTGKLMNFELTCIRKSGEKFPAEITSSIFKDKFGNERTSMIIRDITVRKQAEETINKLLLEKEIILKEVHHRIKNNMSTVKNLLILQSQTLKDPLAIAALEDSGKRVQSMMVLYDKLYRSSNFGEISFKFYLSSLVDDITANFPNSTSVTVEKNIDDFIINVKTLQPLGIIINELLTNIMKYAFTGRDSGIISVFSTNINHHISITVEDNGNGIPDSVDFEHSTGFGLMLIRILTEQLNGTMRIERGDGTRFILEFGI